MEDLHITFAETSNFDFKDIIFLLSKLSIL